MPYIIKAFLAKPGKAFLFVAPTLSMLSININGWYIPACPTIHSSQSGLFNKGYQNIYHIFDFIFNTAAMASNSLNLLAGTCHKSEPYFPQTRTSIVMREYFFYCRN